MRECGGRGGGFQISDLRFQIGLLVVWDRDKWRRERISYCVFGGKKGC